MKIKDNITFNELLLTLAKMPITLRKTPIGYDYRTAGLGCAKYNEYAMNLEYQRYIQAYALSYPNLPSCSFPKIYHTSRCVQPIVHNKYFTIDKSSIILIQDKYTFTEYFVLHDLTSYIIEETYKQRIKHRNKQLLKNKIKKIK